MILRMAVKSLWSRRFTAVVIAVAMAISVALLVTVLKVRDGARNAFIHSISGTDLIVGPRTGSIQLLLHTVFHIGYPTHSLTWKSYEELAKNPAVAWAVPMAMGDSHKGFPVVATNSDFFRFFRYAVKKNIGFASGGPFASAHDAVIGSEIAASLGYRLLDHVVIAHGAGKLEEDEHRDDPFQVAGVLAPTGTPVDRTVYIPLEGMEAMHANRMNGVMLRGVKILRPHVEQDMTLNAILLGLKAPDTILQVQSEINRYQEEPLLAILPRITLEQLWELVRVAERALILVSCLVIMVGLIGMTATLTTALNERRRELAILRSQGAGPFTLCFLLLVESSVLSTVGALLGLLLVHTVLPAGDPWIVRHWGLDLGLAGISISEAWVLCGTLVAGLIAGLLPAYRAYRFSLADGLTIRL